MSGPHSPEPWRIVRSEIPYYSWISDAQSGMVAIGFTPRDEPLLLAAPQLRAVCARLVAWMADGPGAGMGTLDEIVAAARDALAGVDG